MKKKRRLAVLLGALAVAAGLAAVPAFATDTGDPYTGYPETGGEVTGGATVPPTGGDEPSYEEPWTEPTEEPAWEPTPEPSYEEPWTEPTEEPWQDPVWEETPAPSYEEPVTEDPVTQPTEEPSSQEEEDEDESSAAGTTHARRTPRPQSTRKPQGTQQPQATPRPILERPQASLNQESSAGEEASGPNYVTFAQLNLRGNSMAVTLFYGGVACIAAGVLGLIAILVFYIRGRRRRPYEETEGILEEIHQAEARQAPAPAAPAREEPLPPQAPPRPVPPPDAIVPEEASLYTEEFALPPDEDYREEDYGESYGQYREDAPPAYAPGEAGYYEDEDYEDYQDYSEDEDYAEPVSQPPAPQPGQAAPQEEATRAFSTEEILREALRYQDGEDT